jgi:CheY-like chemotaxis protein
MVEDNLDILEVFSCAMESFGYRVVTARDGVEAMVHLQGPERFDYVLSDVSMPGGVSGIDVARRCVELQPQAHMILVSGHHRDQLPPLPDKVRFLAKPYGIPQLLDVLQAGGLPEISASRA